MNKTDLEFKKSSFCSDSACTELAEAEDVVFLRNSTDPDNVIEFDRDMWEDLRARINDGELNV